MREHARLSIARFCELAGVHRATYHRWAACERAGRAVRGPWPAPVRDSVEQAATQLALEWPAWGHRKIWALLEADGFHASQATVRRALRARALLQPPAVTRERRALARSRRAAFSTPPARRNRVWQTDFSEHETTGAGVWQLGGVVDYVAKLALCCPVSATKTWRDAVGVLETARERAHELLGRPLLDDLTDPQTGEITPVILVSDNGACYRAAGFARHIAARPEFQHVRTRHKAPETNGVVERWFQSLKYEHLYRHEIDDGPALANEVERYLAIYNEIRPHEALDFKLPIDRYLRPPTITLKPAIQIGPCGRLPL
jgi:transposase InsO family protein